MAVNIYLFHVGNNEASRASNGVNLIIAGGADANAARAAAAQAMADQLPLSGSGAHIDALTASLIATGATMSGPDAIALTGRGIAHEA